MVFTTAPLTGRSAGFVGFVEFVIFDCFLVRADLRHDRDGRRYIRYPSLPSRSGRRHDVAFPISKAVGDAIEFQVMAALASLVP